MTIQLFLLDDNTLFRKGLAVLLSQQSDLTLVGDAESGKEAMHALSSMEPDVIIMECRLSGSSGLDIAIEMKRRLPQVKLIMLTAARTQEHVRAALRVGVDGYVLKDASLEELLIAIRSVARGKKYLSPDVSGHVVESFLHPELSTGKSSQLDLLTNRERGILQLIAEGRTNRSAAEFLCVSPKTVEKHRASLMQKLGLRNATEMTLVAMEMGLVERPVAFSRVISALTPTNDL